MTSWTTTSTEQYARDQRKYEKKFPNELTATVNNLDTYFTTLQKVQNPLQVTGGFIHNEPSGIKAIDQTGGTKKHKLKQTRLYIYPDTVSKTLYLLCIGDKTSQKRDIQNCKKFVKKLKKNYEN